MISYFSEKTQQPQGFIANIFSPANKQKKKSVEEWL